MRTALAALVLVAGSLAGPAVVAAPAQAGSLRSCPGEHLHDFVITHLTAEYIGCAAAGAGAAQLIRHGHVRGYSCVQHHAAEHVSVHCVGLTDHRGFGFSYHRVPAPPAAR